jgi:hypothetical protein
MSELKVILNKDLNNQFYANKYNKLTETKETRNKDLIKKYDNIYEQKQYKNNIYPERTCNGLVNAFLLAYNNHLPLRLKPDDIHLAIQMVFSTFVNYNAEQLRQTFVSHQDKKELIVNLAVFDFNAFTELIKIQMREHILDKNLLTTLSCDYSTTTYLITAVSNAIIMNTFKEYFSNTCVLGCGIPSIILEGTQDDWNKLYDKYTALKSFCLSIDNCELKDWFSCMDILMTMFKELRNLRESGEINAPDNYIKLWERVISFIPYGSGGAKILGGWISILSPYSSQNKLKNFVKDLPCIDINKDIPKNIGGYTYQNILKKYYGGRMWDDLQDSMLSTPMKLISDIEYEAEMIAGFAQYNHINDKFEVCLNYNIRITREQKNILIK